MTQKGLFSPCEPFPQTPPPLCTLLLLAPYKPAPRCLPLVRGLYLAGDLGVENKALGRFFTWNHFCFVDICISNESDKKRVLFILRNPRKGLQIKTLLILLCILKETMVNELWIMSLWYQAGRLSPRAGNSKLIAPCFRNILSLFTSSLYILLYHSLLISM